MIRMLLFFVLINLQLKRCSCEFHFDFSMNAGFINSAEESVYSSNKIFIISQADFATLVPGPKMAATPAL